MTAAEKINLEVIDKTTQYERGRKKICEEGEDWTTANGWEKWQERKDSFKGNLSILSQGKRKRVSSSKERRLRVIKCPRNTKDGRGLRKPRLYTNWSLNLSSSFITNMSLASYLIHYLGLLKLFLNLSSKSYRIKGMSRNKKPKTKRTIFIKNAIICLLWRIVCLNLLPIVWLDFLFSWYWAVWAAYLF